LIVHCTAKLHTKNTKRGPGISRILGTSLHGKWRETVLQDIFASGVAALAVAAIAFSPAANATECAGNGVEWICPGPQIAYVPQPQAPYPAQVIQPYAGYNQPYRLYSPFDSGARRYPGPALHSAGE
jgi:hypothetical protein